MTMSHGESSLFQSSEHMRQFYVDSRKILFRFEFYEDTGTPD